jgi:hypothetical protein
VGKAASGVIRREDRKKSRSVRGYAFDAIDWGTPADGAPMAKSERIPEAGGPPPDAVPTSGASSDKTVPHDGASPRRRFLRDSVPYVLGILARGLPLPGAATDPAIDTSAERPRSPSPGCDEEPAREAREDLDRCAKSFHRDNPGFGAFGPGRPD